MMTYSDKIKKYSIKNCKYTSNICNSRDMRDGSSIEKKTKSKFSKSLNSTIT